MLRSEVCWFPAFLQLCREKISLISKVWTREENPLIPLLERILTCHSYRHVVQLLRRHHWVTRQAIYELRRQARINTYYPVYHEISLYNFTIQDVGILGVGIQGLCNEKWNAVQPFGFTHRPV